MGIPRLSGRCLSAVFFEGTLGLLAKYWRKLIAPVVAASVVIAIGMSLFSVGARSFGGGLCRGFWLCAESSVGDNYACGLSWLELLCKGLSEAAFRSGGAACGAMWVAILMGKVDLSVIFAGALSPCQS